MRTSDADILIVPGWSNSGPDHWQSRWERNLSTARRVEQDDWTMPSKDAWVGRLIFEITKNARPVVLVAHSLGVAVVAHAARKLPSGSVSGAFLVAPADVDYAERWPETGGQTWTGSSSGFAPLPNQKLTFPSVLIASSNDPYCSLDRAKSLAGAWGSVFVDSGANGHINTASGHGPWPDGLLRFGSFLQRLPNGG